MSCCDSEYWGPVQVGQKVEEFTLGAYNPEKGDFCEFSLEKAASEKKWTVLVFYPADFTFVCPTELADLADSHSQLKEMGACVVSVSTDTKFAHLAWQQSERLLEKVRYLMAADPTGRVSRYFGVYDEEEGTALRGTFIINPDGILVGSEINHYNVGRSAEELVRKVRAFTYLNDKPGEVCPARWEQGEATLTPSEKMVGRVGESMKSGS